MASISEASMHPSAGVHVVIRALSHFCHISTFVQLTSGVSLRYGHNRFRRAEAEWFIRHKGAPKLSLKEE